MLPYTSWTIKNATFGNFVLLRYTGEDLCLEQLWLFGGQDCWKAMTRESKMNIQKQELRKWGWPYPKVLKPVQHRRGAHTGPRRIAAATVCFSLYTLQLPEDRAQRERACRSNVNIRSVLCVKSRDQDKININEKNCKSTEHLEKKQKALLKNDYCVSLGLSGRISVLANLNLQTNRKMIQTSLTKVTNYKIWKNVVISKWVISLLTRYPWASVKRWKKKKKKKHLTLCLAWRLSPYIDAVSCRWCRCPISIKLPGRDDHNFDEAGIDFQNFAEAFLEPKLQITKLVFLVVAFAAIDHDVREALNVGASASSTTQACSEDDRNAVANVHSSFSGRNFHRRKILYFSV